MTTSHDDRKRRPYRTSQAPRPSQKLATLQQLEAENGPPVATWRRAVRNGEIPFIVFPGSRRIWIDRADAQRYVANSKEIMCDGVPQAVTGAV